MRKLKSIKGKLKTLSKTKGDGVVEGLKNYVTVNLEVEKTANKRALICKGCEFFEIEPIETLRMKDKRIPVFNNMFCSDCFCSLPIKSRQNITICKNWNI